MTLFSFDKNSQIHNKKNVEKIFGQFVGFAEISENFIIIFWKKHNFRFILECFTS